MSTALVLDADGRRKDGKWSYGSVAVTQRSESGTLSAQWKQRLAEAGIVLDHAPDLTEQVVNGDLALDAAHRPAHRVAPARRGRPAQHARPAHQGDDSTAGSTHGQGRLEHAHPAVHAHTTATAAPPHARLEDATPHTAVSLRGCSTVVACPWSGHPPPHTEPNPPSRPAPGKPRAKPQAYAKAKPNGKAQEWRQ